MEDIKDIKLGYAICGSFCTFRKSIEEMKRLAGKGADIYPIMSQNAYSLDTRFGMAADFIDEIETICGKSVIHTIPQAEPIGPRKLLDILVISPCTGNTLAKLASGVTDTPVTLAAKAHLRNARPLVIGVSTNDALAAAAKNIGALMNCKNIYFIPMSQDDPKGKPNSIVVRFDRTEDAILHAMKKTQLQPVYL
jgi:dipicolinic acid synthetase, B subunit